jgi:DNA-nicking Smr family endonuclease
MSEDNPWAQYARGVKKLDGKKDPELAEDNEVVSKTPKSEFEALIEDAPSLPLASSDPEPQQQEPKPKAIPAQPEFLDIRIERNLSLGDVVVEAKIDLHGKTEEEAYQAFRDFVEKQAELKRRLLLIITGKGKEGHSVLRQNLPRWCEVDDFRNKILALRVAAPHHGGDGAYYLLLRKS